MPNRPTLTDPRDIRDLNLASGIAVAVGIYSLFVALGMMLQPPQYWGSASFIGYVIGRISPWPPAAFHLALAALLVWAAKEERRLVLALAVVTGAFGFWSLAPLVAARLGVLPYPSITGFLNYAWFASISAFALYRVWRLERRRGSDEALRGRA